MPARRLRPFAAATSTTALLAAGLLSLPSAAAAPTPPVLEEWANPGVAHTGSEYVMLHTVRWDRPGASATAPKPNGPWKKTGKQLLTERPAWASGKNKSVWAPSLVQGRDGKWVVYYSAVRKGSEKSRCIGTGVAEDPRGPFTPQKRPIACPAGSGTDPRDPIPSAGGTMSVIDATPAVFEGETVLTYKTQRGYTVGGKQRWETAIRMLRLDPENPRKVIGNPVNANGNSVELTKARHKYIEENPSLVFRKGTYTLFTSWGWYGTHDQYWTRYRQNTDLWKGWKAKKPTRLSFPGGTQTRGQGNAHAMKSPDGWHLFWNGQKAAYQRGDGPKNLYVGKLTWKGGKPAVSKVLSRR